jgi:hypothetical protein
MQFLLCGHRFHCKISKHNNESQISHAHVLSSEEGFSIGQGVRKTSRLDRLIQVQPNLVSIICGMYTSQYEWRRFECKPPVFMFQYYYYTVPGTLVLQSRKFRYILLSPTHYTKYVRFCFKMLHFQHLHTLYKLYVHVPSLLPSERRVIVKCLQWTISGWRPLPCRRIAYLLYTCANETCKLY